jgi:hypothetical protein
MEMHTYNPSYEGGIGRRITVRAAQAKSMKPYLKKN